MGVSLSLPLLESHLAQAEPSPTRRRFIAAYVPNGAYMPAAKNGDWTWDGALKPLVDQGLRNNVMMVRQLFNGFETKDPHWQNCAGFLSCEPIVLGDPGVARCGVTVDQIVAERLATKIPAMFPSLEIGGVYYHVHLLASHAAYSSDYLNRISWQAPDKFRSPIGNPAHLFAKLFGGQQGGTAQIDFLHSRKRSVLDQLHKDAQRLAARLPESYRPVLASYMETVREVELGLSKGGFQCQPTMSAPRQDFTHPNTNYRLRFHLMHQMLVLAMQCGLTNTATLMYGPGISADLTFAEDLGPGVGHHTAAHHGGTASSIERLKAISRVQTGLLADLLLKLKTANLLDSTLVVYGSDMSDGNVHATTNLPTLLCGAGTDLKFGQEITPSSKRPLSDLYVETFNLLGMTDRTRFGSGECASTGQPLGIRA